MEFIRLTYTKENGKKQRSPSHNRRMTKLIKKKDIIFA